ncbi:MAG: hypothetical protein GEU83_20420 [Pseudonocardiaceae bacterium]|nr:hypothetical protein [Pseudonocardiaceae bacterium]
MSALDDLVSTLQAAVSSAESAYADGVSAERSAGEAVQAATVFGRADDVARVDALRSALESNNATLANAQKTYEELLEQAVALQGGGG